MAYLQNAYALPDTGLDPSEMLAFPCGSSLPTGKGR